MLWNPKSVCIRSTVMQLRAWFHHSTQTSWWSRFRTKSSVSRLWAQPWARQHEVQLEVRFRKMFPQPWPHVRSRFMKSSVSRLWAQQHKVWLEADLKYDFDKRPLASPWLQPHVWPLPKKKGTADIFRSKFTDMITDTSYIIPTWDMTLMSKVTTMRIMTSITKCSHFINMRYRSQVLKWFI